MATTSYAGINYAGPFAPETNRDPATGIRYGVISQNEVLQAWADSSEPDYPEAEVECPECSTTVLQTKVVSNDETDSACPECGADLANEFEHAFDCIDSVNFVLDDGEYKATSDSYGDIFILSSPYFTYAQFCSPCAPGACHLENPLSEPIEDNKCYCFGHEFFEDSKAPYPVYLVSTGELVEPPVEE